MKLKYLDLFKCYWIFIDSGVLPNGGGGGWMGVCERGGCVRGSPMHACIHIHMHASTHTCMLNMIKMDTSMLVAICNFYTCIHVCAWMCMHAHGCAHVWGYPHAPRHPPTHLSLPRATGSPKHQNSMSLELIKIFQFCLKILYLWTLLNSYTL